MFKRVTFFSYDKYIVVDILKCNLLSRPLIFGNTFRNLSRIRSLVSVTPPSVRCLVVASLCLAVSLVSSAWCLGLRFLLNFLLDSWLSIWLFFAFFSVFPILQLSLQLPLRFSLQLSSRTFPRVFPFRLSLWLSFSLALQLYIQLFLLLYSFSFPSSCHFDFLVTLPYHLSHPFRLTSPFGACLWAVSLHVPLTVLQTIPLISARVFFWFSFLTFLFRFSFWFSRLDFLILTSPFDWIFPSGLSLWSFPFDFPLELSLKDLPLETPLLPLTSFYDVPSPLWTFFFFFVSSDFRTSSSPFDTPDSPSNADPLVAICGHSNKSVLPSDFRKTQGPILNKKRNNFVSDRLHIKNDNVSIER